MVDSSDTSLVPEESLYASVDHHDHSKPLPYTNSSYQVIASLLPPGRTHFSPPLSEIGRILKDEGYGLVGASESVWRNERLIDSLLHVPECTLLSALDINCGKQPMEEAYYLAVLVKKTFDD